MNEKELKIRKQWLLLLITSTVLTLICNIVCISTDSSLPLSPASMYFLRAFTTLFPLGWSLLLYRCAYKKPGTKFLTVLLFLTPATYIAMAGVYIFRTVQLPSTAWWYWGYNLLTTGLAIWWYTLHWKMRTINKKIKALLKMPEVV